MLEGGGVSCIQFNSASESALLNNRNPEAHNSTSLSSARSHPSLQKGQDIGQRGHADRKNRVICQSMWTKMNRSFCLSTSLSWFQTPKTGYRLNQGSLCLWSILKYSLPPFWTFWTVSSFNTSMACWSLCMKIRLGSIHWQLVLHKSHCNCWWGIYLREQCKAGFLVKWSFDNWNSSKRGQADKEGFKRQTHRLKTAVLTMLTSKASYWNL